MKKSAAILSILLSAGISAFAQTLADNLVLTLSNPDGVYSKGEKVKVFAELKDAAPGLYDMKTYINGIDKGSSQVEIKGDGKPVFSAKYKKPTAIVLKFSLPGNPKDATSVGFVAAPEGFTPGFDRPADFDEYWKGEIAKLRALPEEVRLTEVELKGPDAEKYVCYDFELNCLGGKPVVGYLAYPRNAAPKSLPIFMLLHAAGVNAPHAYATPRGALGLAKSGNGAIGLDINAHGMPNGRPQSYYDGLAKGELKSYSSRVVTDRESFYFYGMILREQRALDYLCRMPEWDGKRVLLRGQSQGGFQACSLAGLDPRVSAAVIIVPAGLDVGGFVKGRLGSWPKPMNVPGQDADAVMAVAPYFDCAQFLKGCKAEFHAELGLIDFTCPPAGCFAALNGVAGKKTIMTDPYRPHGNVAAPYKADWQNAQSQAREEWIKEYLK